MYYSDSKLIFTFNDELQIHNLKTSKKDSLKNFCGDFNKVIELYNENLLVIQKDSLIIVDKTFFQTQLELIYLDITFCDEFEDEIYIYQSDYMLLTKVDEKGNKLGDMTVSQDWKNFTFYISNSASLSIERSDRKTYLICSHYNQLIWIDTSLKNGFQNYSFTDSEIIGITRIKNSLIICHYNCEIYIIDDKGRKELMMQTISSNLYIVPSNPTFIGSDMFLTHTYGYFAVWNIKKSKCIYYKEEPVDRVLIGENEFIYTFFDGKVKKWNINCPEYLDLFVGIKKVEGVMEVRDGIAMWNEKEVKVIDKKDGESVYSSNLINEFRSGNCILCNVKTFLNEKRLCNSCDNLYQIKNVDDSPDSIDSNKCARCKINNCLPNSRYCMECDFTGLMNPVPYYQPSDTFNLKFCAVCNKRIEGELDVCEGCMVVMNPASYVEPEEIEMSVVEDVPCIYCNKNCNFKCTKILHSLIQNNEYEGDGEGRLYMIKKDRKNVGYITLPFEFDKFELNNIIIQVCTLEGMKGSVIKDIKF